VFEENYAEDTTAGYVHQDSDVLWLDRELIEAQSNVCATLILDFERNPDPEIAVRLAAAYHGRFALDFSYDEWATDFREWLHVAFLHVVETQIHADVDTGNFQRGVAIARRALEVEPRNEELEVGLIKLLGGAGAHSAAAEQYSHYANLVRTDLGVEPKSMEAL